MYLQIRIPPEDRPKFRFLRGNLKVDHDPDVYKFERVLFGVASAPLRAHFVSQGNARIHKETLCFRLTFMDDSLDSTWNNDRAVQLFREL